jgi:hypothetical protein
MGGRCVLGPGQAWAASCRWKAVAGRVRAADGCRRRFVAVVVVVVVVVSKGAGARRRAAESNVISAEGDSGDDSWASDAGRASLAGAPIRALRSGWLGIASLLTNGGFFLLVGTLAVVGF